MARRVRSNPRGGMGSLIVLGAAGAFIVGGSAGQLPAALQGIYDQTIGRLGVSRIGGATPTVTIGSGAGSTDCLSAVTKIGNGAWLAPLWCNDHNGTPPHNLDEFNAWGTQKGYRKANGSWSLT